MAWIRGGIKALRGGASRWAALSLALNLVWEVAQLPLYTIFRDESPARVAYAVVRCTAGDGLIAAASFVLASAALRDPGWVASKPWRGGAICVAAGMIYAAFSEWRNVYRLGSWAYTPSMPLVFGVGLTPLLQWLAIPAMMIAVLRAARSRNRKT
jgi:hypothetical protein